MAPSTTLPDWFARAFEGLQDGDIERYLEIYAPDAVHEFPFAAEGAVRRLEGRASIASYLAKLPGQVRFNPLQDVRVHEAGEVTVIEATGRHRSIPDDAPRDIRYVLIITRRNGLVTHVRDYMGPALP
jgi:uncharacterized protein